MNEHNKHEFIDYAAIHFAAGMLANPECYESMSGEREKLIILTTSVRFANELYGMLHKQEEKKGDS